MEDLLRAAGRILWGPSVQKVLQGQPGFHAPYSGTNSLYPGDNFRQTSEADLFIDVRLWPSDLGAFLRLAARNPNYEAWQFSDASRSWEVGLSLKGTAWKRPNDTIEFAEMAAGIGHAEQAYFNAGGLGIPGGRRQAAGLRSRERPRILL